LYDNQLETTFKIIRIDVLVHAFSFAELLPAFDSDIGYHQTISNRPLQDLIQLSTKEMLSMG